MSNLIVIAFRSKDAASRALTDALRMHDEALLAIEDACVVERKPNGKVKLHQTVDVATPSMVNGVFWGLLVGLLFGLPLIGGLAGAAVGGVSGLLTDIGVSDEFMKRLGNNLVPGSAALFVQARDEKLDRVLERVRGWDGTVLHTSLSRGAEATLKRSLASLLNETPTVGVPQTTVAEPQLHA